MKLFFMKYIILFFVLIISLQSFSQDVNKSVDERIEAKLAALPPSGSASVDSLIRSLEKIYIKTKISSGTFILDTLTCDNNTAASFHLEIIGGTTGRGYKWVTINNVNGIYNIVGNVNLSSFTGITGALFECVKVGNSVVVRITSPAVTSWKLKRY